MPAGMWPGVLETGTGRRSWPLEGVEEQTMAHLGSAESAENGGPNRRAGAGRRAPGGGEAGDAAAGQQQQQQQSGARTARAQRRRSMLPRSTGPATDSLHSLLSIQTSSALQTKVPAHKRHSVLISALDDREPASRPAPAQQKHRHRHHSVLDFDALAAPPLEKSQSQDSWLDFSAALDDPEIVLKHIDLSDADEDGDEEPAGAHAAPAPHACPKPGDVSEPESDVSDDSIRVAGRKRSHPLRKLIVNSPVGSRSPSLLKLPTSSSRLNLHSTGPKGKQRPPAAASSSAASSPYKKLIQPTHTPPGPYQKLTTPSPIHKPITAPKLHLYTTVCPDCLISTWIVGGCVFIGRAPETRNSPAETSHASAQDVFSGYDDSPIKRSSTNKNMDTLLIPGLASTLVDPELFSRSASSVFAGPSLLPPRHRTALHFL